MTSTVKDLVMLQCNEQYWPTGGAQASHLPHSKELFSNFFPKSQLNLFKKNQPNKNIKKPQHHNNNEAKQNPNKTNEQNKTKQKTNQPKISTREEICAWHNKILNSFQFLNE